MASHSVWRFGLVVTAFLAFVAVCIINALSNNKTLFKSTISKVSAKYNTSLTPAGWTFSIWGFIYAWQAIHLIYGFTLLCRKNNNRGYLYVDPDFIGAPFYIAYIISCLCNIGWLFCYDREFLIPALLMLIAISVSLYICHFFAARYLYKAGAEMENNNLKYDIWLARILVHNGIAFYYTWTNVASLINLWTVLHYVNGVAPYICTWIASAILTVIVITTFILEVFVFDKYLRYTFSHYITLVVALSGVIYRNYNADQPEQNYAIFLLCFAAVLGLAKVAIMIYRGVRHPINYQQMDSNVKVSYSNGGIVA